MMETGVKILSTIIVLQAALILALSFPSVETALYAPDADIPQQHITTTPGPAPYVLEPNSTMFLETAGKQEKTYLVRTNSRGLRDGEFGEYQADSKIVVVGDSITFGWGVNRTDRFTEICGGRLEETEVLNAGIPGYGMEDYLGLVRENITGLEPDARVIVFSEGDAVSYSDINSSGKSSIEVLAAKLKLRGKQGLDSENISETMDKLANPDQGKPVYFMSYWPLSGEARRFMESWTGERENVFFIPSPDEFRQEGMKDFVFSGSDPHLNARAHRLLADTLCRGLEDRGLND